MKVLAINGSYRDDGITDQIVEVMLTSLRSRLIDVEQVLLRDYPIEFCLNCRECMQHPGDIPGQCVHQDSMRELVEKIEQSNAFILASPTNMGSVTALFKRFMERLAVYAYWPWGKPAPTFRKAHEKNKKAILVSSCAAPGLMGRWLYSTHGQLKMTAQAIGAKKVGVIFPGLIAQHAHQKISARVQAKARKLTRLLIDA